MYKRKSYKICSVRKCQNTSANSKCHFFGFPKDNERLREWAIACCREDLLERMPERVHSNNKVCSDHFEDKMYANDLKNRLLPVAKPVLNLDENLENNQNNNCANVKTNTSGIRQTTHLLKEEERLQLSSEHDVQAKHNISLEPINIIANSLQPSIVANNNMTDPKIPVTAGPSNNVVDHRGAQLPLNQTMNKNIQTTKDLSAHTPRKLKLKKENRILKRENDALREIIKEMSDVTEDQFLRACEKFLSPHAALFVREQISSGKKKV